MKSYRKTALLALLGCMLIGLCSCHSLKKNRYDRCSHFSKAVNKTELQGKGRG